MTVSNPKPTAAPPDTPAPLVAEQVYRSCDPSALAFETVDQLEDLPTLVGQDRAVEAVEFGIGMRRPGYNMFAYGPSGIGKHFFVRDLLSQKAVGEAAPADWCYVHNFENTQKPRALRLPAGMGISLRESMRRLVDDLRAALPATFESDDYRSRRQVVDEEFKKRHEEAFSALQRRVQEQHIALIRTPMGLALAPIRNGEVLDPEEFRQLPPHERERLNKTMEDLQKELEQIIHQAPVWAREHRQQVRKLNRDVTHFAVVHMIDELRALYRELPEVLDCLNAVERDIVENADDFLAGDHGRPESAFGLMVDPATADSFRFRRYSVNVLVDNSMQRGAPVVYEDNPTVQNLVGRIEHLARFGALVTDFSLLKPGALHRANGGYLILDAYRLLANALAYEALKRTLRSGQIRIQSLEQMLSFSGTSAPDAEPIPLSVKVVLVGPRLIYYLLCELDPDFSELFKVAVDFEDRVDRDPANMALFARLIATMVRRHKLRALDRAAVARVIEHASRLCGDNEKLTTHAASIMDLLQESDHWAAAAGKKIVGAAEVQQAIDAKQRRVDRLYRQLQEEIRRDTLHVETDGARVGQVNGLSVISLGGMSFGHPSRITAQARLGPGRVVDIEREVKLGGKLHSKGVMILSGFLGGRFARNAPLSLHASLVFEQSYGEIEGDSASCAELYALISAIGEMPIRQWLAVTGSVDQHGRVQAIGGVNEKIEGFFDLCAARGFTGRQGALIPASNVKHLMLRPDVVEAIRQKKFHVYPVETVDQGLALLTGMPAGEPDGDGSYPPGTVNRRVADRLSSLTAKSLELAKAAGGPRGGEEHRDD